MQQQGVVVVKVEEAPPPKVDDPPTKVDVATTPAEVAVPVAPAVAEARASAGCDRALHGLHYVSSLVLLLAYLLAAALAVVDQFTPGGALQGQAGRGVNWALVALLLVSTVDSAAQLVLGTGELSPAAWLEVALVTMSLLSLLIIFLWWVAFGASLIMLWSGLRVWVRSLLFAQLEPLSWRRVVGAGPGAQPRPAPAPARAADPSKAGAAEQAGKKKKKGKSYSFRTTVRRAMTVLWQWKARCVYTVALIVLKSAGSPVTAFIVGAALGQPVGSVWPYIVALFATGFVVLAAMGLARASTATLFSHGSERLQRALALRALELESASGPPAGELSSSFSQGLSKVQSLWAYVFFGLVQGLASLLISICFVGSVSVVAMVSIISTMPIIVASQRYVKVVANGFSERYNKLLASKQSEVRNLIALRLEANVMCAQAFLMARWDRSAGPTREALHDSNFWASASQLLFQMLTMAVYLSALLWVLFSVAAGTMSLSAGISFYGYVTSVWSALNSLAGISRRVLVNAGSVNALMDMVDAAAAAARGDKQQKPPPGAVPAHTQPLALDVEDAHLVFPGAAAPSLDGLSLHVRAGDYVALMGASGSGKTTLLKLVAGAVPPQRGAVRGVDPRSVAIVSQRPELLIGSVRDNIAFGHECSQEDVEQAARDAAVHDVIERLPEKYDTVLGDDEASRGLSGGEQLRLTLARALCRQPALLVLDECTAALDSASEALVLANLAHVHQQRRTATTILMATHSHAAAAAADYVVMLAQGRVVEQGPYAALLQQHGALWRLQQVVQHGIRPATTEGHASTTRSSQPLLALSS